MTFIKYLLGCFANVFDDAHGGKSTNKEDVDNKTSNRNGVRDSFVFLLEILAFIAIFAFFGFVVFNRIIKNDILVWVFTMLSTIATILVFCLICILVEALLNLIIKLTRKNKSNE